MRGEPRPRVLVVDDEPGISEVLTKALTNSGYEVETACNGHQALEAVRKGGLDAVLLDVMLPDMTGFEVMQRWSDEGHAVPTLFLTARADEEDVTHGLSIGGDDYVRKPFGIAELIARVRTVLRRSGTASGTGTETSILRFADLRLDQARMEAHRAGRPLHLSPTELRLLETLMVNSGRILTRNQLISLVWDSAEAADESTLETTISRLRRKLNSQDEKDLLVTRRGVGYGLVATRTSS